MRVTLSHRGLPDGIGPFKLIALVKEVARSADKAFRISRTAVDVFEHYALSCQQSDFAKGEICGMWEQPATIAAKLRISTKVFNNAESELRSKGYIEKTSRAHARRYGERRNNKIISLAGISLKPVIDGYDRLIAARHAMELQQMALTDLRSEIAQLRRQIRDLEYPDLADRVEQILPGGRASRINDMAKLTAIKADLVALLVFIEVPSGEQKCSDQTEENVAPNILNQDSFENCSDAIPHRDVRDDPAPLSPDRIAELASEDYKELLAANGGPSWPNLVETSAMATSWLGISQSVWGDACQTMGRERAAICVLIIDRNWRLPIEHRYRGRRPAGCFKGMIAKGASKLNLNGMLRAAVGFPEGGGSNVSTNVQPHFEATPDRSAIAHFSSKLLSRITVTECKEDHQC